MVVTADLLKRKGSREEEESAGGEEILEGITETPEEYIRGKSRVRPPFGNRKPETGTGFNQWESLFPPLLLALDQYLMAPLMDFSTGLGYLQN